MTSSVTCHNGKLMPGIPKIRKKIIIQIQLNFKIKLLNDTGSNVLDLNWQELGSNLKSITREAHYQWRTIHWLNEGLRGPPKLHE